MTDVILKRRIEAISGMYSHPDISKFIYNVLLHFETPIVDNLIKLKILREAENRERNKLFVAHEILNIITL